MAFAPSSFRIMSDVADELYPSLCDATSTLLVNLLNEVNSGMDAHKQRSCSADSKKTYNMTKMHSGISDPLSHGSITPAYDLVRSNDVYTVTVDMPGYKKSDVKVSVAAIGNEASLMSITAERLPRQNAGTEMPDAETNVQEHVIASNRKYGKISLSVMLPKDTNADAMTATIVDGVLTVTVPIIQSKPSENVRFVPVA